jgi:hypothetical protein
LSMQHRTLPVETRCPPTGLLYRCERSVGLARTVTGGVRLGSGGD